MILLYDGREKCQYPGGDFRERSGLMNKKVKLLAPESLLSGANSKVSARLFKGGGAGGAVCQWHTN